ncbi:unnamed protein product [Camellia sinensis]
MLLFEKAVQRHSLSIIIMPAFGVQLETHYSRCQTGERKSCGRIIHRFIPIEKILKPVLNECVTPVTRYWNLSLIVREEEELELVFKGTSPTSENVNPNLEGVMCCH